MSKANMQSTSVTDSASKLEEKGNSLRKKILPILGTCNNNCIFCGGLKEYKTCTLEEIKQELDKARLEGCLQVVFTGGEPTIHPNIIEAVSYARQIGFSAIHIVTNGRMLSYPDFAKDIAEAGLTEAIFSIHGSTPKIHDAHTGVPGSLEQLIAGVKNLSKYKSVRLCADTTITKLNYTYLPDTIKLILSLGIKENINIIGLWLINSAFVNREIVMPDYSKVRPYLGKAIDILLENKATFFILRYPPQYLEGHEKYFPLIHTNVQDILAFVEEFRGNDMPSCKGAKCSYCEFLDLCPELTLVNRSILHKSQPVLARINLGGNPHSNLFSPK